MDNNKRIKRKVRNAYLVSTISISLVLFLLGGVGYLIMGALNASQQLKENMAVYVMLKSDVTPEQTAAVKGNLVAKPEVKNAVFVSKDAAAADFKTYLGDDFVEFLEQNPLPDSYEVRFNATDSEKTVIEALEKEALKWDGVEEVVYQRNVIEQISANINKFNAVLLFFGGTLLIISLILLNNTIRVTIFSRRYIINTMKLVGATRWFIMRPFLASSIYQGLYAGLISWVMLTLLIMGLSDSLPEVTFVSEQLHLGVIYAAMLVGGILISLLFTAFAVRKFIRMSSSNIHIY